MCKIQRPPTCLISSSLFCSLLQLQLQHQTCAYSGLLKSSCGFAQSQLNPFPLFCQHEAPVVYATHNRLSLHDPHSTEKALSLVATSPRLLIQRRQDWAQVEFLWPRCHRLSTTASCLSAWWPDCAMRVLRPGAGALSPIRHQKQPLVGPGCQSCPSTRAQERPS